MAHEMGERAVDLVGVNTRNDELADKKPQRGEMVFGIRIDALPESDAKRLADEGRFYPLTMDKQGQLRVVLPSDQKFDLVKLQQVLSESRNFLEEIRNLLMEMA